MNTGGFPSLDWAMVVAFIGIAGAGGLEQHAVFQLRARQGLGDGRAVGAIPSAIGGRTIGLSHIGCVFRPESDNLARWRGWMRHIQSAIRESGSSPRSWGWPCPA